MAIDSTLLSRRKFLGNSGKIATGGASRELPFPSFMERTTTPPRSRWSAVAVGERSGQQCPFGFLGKRADQDRGHGRRRAKQARPEPQGLSQKHKDKVDAHPSGHIGFDGYRKAMDAPTRVTP